MLPQTFAVAITPTPYDDHPPHLFLGRVDPSRLFLHPDRAPQGDALAWGVAFALAWLQRPSNLTGSNGGHPMPWASAFAYGYGWEALEGFATGVVRVDDGRPRPEATWTLSETLIPHGHSQSYIPVLEGPGFGPVQPVHGAWRYPVEEPGLYHDTLVVADTGYGRRRRASANDIDIAQAGLVLGALQRPEAWSLDHPVWLLLALLEACDLPNGQIFPDRHNRGWSCIFSRSRSYKAGLPSHHVQQWAVEQRYVLPNHVLGAAAFMQGPRWDLATAALPSMPTAAFGTALVDVAAAHHDTLLAMVPTFQAGGTSDMCWSDAEAMGCISAHSRLRHAAFCAAFQEAAARSGVL